MKGFEVTSYTSQFNNLTNLCLMCVHQNYKRIKIQADNTQGKVFLIGEGDDAQDLL